MDFWNDRPYVPAANRRAQAVKQVEKLKKKGRAVLPVVIEGRKIAHSFWGAAWCENLERYYDFENRLPRGRAYARNGSIVDLQISRGSIRALVSGSDLYAVKIEIALTTPQRWKAICRDCSGSIHSLVELLKGKLSKNVMERVCKENGGLFPAPREIKMSCSCPDSAGMCKHAAAALYGVGARLDSAPELLFALRGVAPDGLAASARLDYRRPQSDAISRRILADDDVAALFGVEMTPPPLSTTPMLKEPAKRAREKASAPSQPSIEDKVRKTRRPVRKKSKSSTVKKDAATGGETSQHGGPAPTKPVKNKIAASTMARKTRPRINLKTA